MTPRILIVEDEEALTQLLRYNLEAAGYEVESVTSGDEADLRFKERAPDLVILDWMLPGLSGIEICRRLRARPDTRTLPIIMLTARGEESERVRGLATGADDYVVKPFSLPELMARVNALLRRASPERVADVLGFGDIEIDRQKSASPAPAVRWISGRPSSGCSIPDGAAGARILAPAVARRRVGFRHLYRQAPSTARRPLRKAWQP
jgi:DNA-binding response OmpR family regulator